MERARARKRERESERPEGTAAITEAGKKDNMLRRGGAHTRVP